CPAVPPPATTTVGAGLSRSGEPSAFALSIASPIGHCPRDASASPSPASLTSGRPQCSAHAAPITARALYPIRYPHIVARSSASRVVPDPFISALSASPSSASLSLGTSHDDRIPGPCAYVLLSQYERSCRRGVPDGPPCRHPSGYPRDAAPEVCRAPARATASGVRTYPDPVSAAPRPPPVRGVRSWPAVRTTTSSRPATSRRTRS